MSDQISVWYLLLIPICVVTGAVCGAMLALHRKPPPPINPRGRLRYMVGRWYDKKVQAQIDKSGPDRAKANLKRQGVPDDLAEALTAWRAR